MVNQNLEIFEKWRRGLKIKFFSIGTISSIFLLLVMYFLTIGKDSNQHSFRIKGEKNSQIECDIKKINSFSSKEKVKISVYCNRPGLYQIKIIQNLNTEDIVSFNMESDRVIINRIVDLESDFTISFYSETIEVPSRNVHIW